MMDEQLAALKDEVEALSSRIDTLIESVEETADRAESKSVVERYGVIIGAGMSLLIFVLGYFLKDTVDLALRERQVELASAEAVQGLVLQLVGTGTGEEQSAAAVALAGFGKPAIAPLVRQLRLRSVGARDVGMEGLRAVALDHHAETCDALDRVIGERRRDYPVWSHMAAAGLLRQLRCSKALESLRTLRRLMAGEGDKMSDQYRRESEDQGLILTSDFDAALQAVDLAIAELEEEDQ